MIKIMTDKMLNEIISKAKSEMWQEMQTEQKLDRIQSQLYEIDARLMKEDDLWMGGNEFPNFCPNCGADMREREEDDEVD